VLTSRWAQKRLSHGQTVLRVERQFGWVGGIGNDRDRTTGWKCVHKVGSRGREIVFRDRIRDQRRTPLNHSAPLFIPKEESPVAIVVINMWNPERAADIAARLVQLELGPWLPRGFREVIIGIVI